MKRYIKFLPYIIGIFIFCCCSFVVCYKVLIPKYGSGNMYDDKVYFNCENITLKVGESTLLEAGYKTNDEDYTIEWSNDNPNVLMIYNGTLLGLEAGEGVVTAKFTEYGISKTCKVKVVAEMSTTPAVSTTPVVPIVPTIPTVSELEISNNNISLFVGETYTINTNMSNDVLKWSSDNNGVVTVQNGVVTAVGVGKATITVATLDGQSTATITVTVNSVPTGDSGNNVVNISVSDVTLNKKSASMYVGDTLTLNATISPSNATNKNVTWSSSNESIAVVQNGVVTAIGKGSATITVTTVDGKKTDEIELTVKKKTIKVSSVSLNKSKVTMYVDGKVTLKATILPSNATNKNVTWSSSNKKVVTVKNGVVTGVAKGTATVTVTTKDGKKTAKATITVKNKPVEVTGVSLNKSKLSLSVNGTATLKATVSPSNATNKKLTWSSSNENVATVNAGVVTAKGNGTAAITVQTNNGITATCLVIVGKPVLKISSSKITLIDERTRRLTATLSYAELDQSVTWSSSNSSVATVNKNGLVKAKSVGTTTITATSNYDPSITVSCVVTVRKARFLFIGNSKTYYPGTVDQDNGIPKRFAAIAKSAGYDVDYTSAVVGGVALNEILNNYPDRVAKIKAKYDYVILNEGTTRAYNNRSGYYNDVNTINTWVKEKNSNVKVYVRKMWIRVKKNSNGIPTNGSTATQIQKSYDNAEYIAEKLGVETINDGALFYDMLDNQSSIYIMRYQSEDSSDLVHQNATGAYLAGLCFYAEVFDKDPTKVTENYGINSSTANTLKTYAKKHCYNN